MNGEPITVASGDEPAAPLPPYQAKRAEDHGRDPSSPGAVPPFVAASTRAGMPSGARIASPPATVQVSEPDAEGRGTGEAGAAMETPAAPEEERAVVAEPADDLERIPWEEEPPVKAAEVVPMDALTIPDDERMPWEEPDVAVSAGPVDHTIPESERMPWEEPAETEPAIPVDAIAIPEVERMPWEENGDAVMEVAPQTAQPLEDTAPVTAEVEPALAATHPADEDAPPPPELILARRLEALAADLRESGASAITSRLASPDRLEALLASLLVGYLAGMSD